MTCSAIPYRAMQAPRVVDQTRPLPRVTSMYNCSLDVCLRDNLILQSDGNESSSGRGAGTAAGRNFLLVRVDRRGNPKVNPNLERDHILQRQPGRRGSNSRRSEVVRRFGVVY